MTANHESRSNMRTKNKKNRLYSAYKINREQQGKKENCVFF